MPEPGPRQPSRQSGGRPPPNQADPGGASGPPRGWDQPASRSPRYATQAAPPTGAYYPSEAPTVPPPARTATRAPVTPAAQRPRPPAGPVQRDAVGRDGRRPDGAAAGAAAAVGAAAATSTRPAKVVRGVRSRRLIRRFDIWSVFKVSVVFYICVFIVMIIAGAGLWNVAAAFGVITDAEKLVRSLFALTTFTLHPVTALLWGAVIAGAVCFLGVLFNVFAAVVYNLISDVVGGVQVIVVSDQGHEDSV